MKKKVFMLLIVFIILFSSTTVFSEENIGVRIRYQVGSSVIRIWLDPDGDGEGSTGTGFFISDRHVVTNHHCVSQYLTDRYIGGKGWFTSAVGDEIELIFSRKSEETAKAKVIQDWPEVDLAVIELEKPTNKRTPVKFAPENEIVEGMDVIVVGFPGIYSDLNDLENADRPVIAKGELSNRITSSIGTSKTEYIEQCYTALINPGNSGGPVVDVNGNVIGIANSGRDNESETGYFGIDVKELKTRLDKANIPYTVAVSAPKPTAVPTMAPKPTAVPTMAPKPTAVPTTAPKPTSVPTSAPKPTAVPTAVPTQIPSPVPNGGSTVIIILAAAAVGAGVMVYFLIKKKNESAEKDKTYQSAKALMDLGGEENFKKAITLFRQVPGWKEADRLASDCTDRIRKIELGRKERLDQMYFSAKSAMQENTKEGFEKAFAILQSIQGWRDANVLAKECEIKIKNFVETPTPPQPPEPTDSSASLQGLSGQFKGTRKPLSRSKDTIIGRDGSECDIVFDRDYKSVSRKHCRIHFSKSHQRYVIQDLNSSNGTILVRGSDQRKVPSDSALGLRDGDIICLANEKNSFRVCL